MQGKKKYISFDSDIDDLNSRFFFYVFACLNDFFSIKFKWLNTRLRNKMIFNSFFFLFPQLYLIHDRVRCHHHHHVDTVRLVPV